MTLLRIGVGVVSAWLLAACSPGAEVDSEPRQESTAQRPPGVVVEEVRPGTAGAFAGLAPGDLLTSWIRLESSDRVGGDFTDPFTYAAVIYAESLGGPVRLIGRRDREPLDVAIGPGDWGLKIRPDFASRALETYRAAREGSDPEQDPVVVLRQLAASLGEGETASLAWLHGEIGTLLARSKRWPEVEKAFGLAAEAAASLASPTRARAHLLMLEATALGNGRQASGAIAAQERAVALIETLDPESLTFAHYLARLARWYAGFGRLAEADALLQRAFELRRSQAPGSFAEAKSLAGLGTLAAVQGRTEQARAALEEARTILADRAPVSPEMAWCLGNLGLMAKRRGDLASAQQLLAASLAASPDPMAKGTAAALNNLGTIARQRGRLDQAEEYWRRAHAINLELWPESVETAGTLSNLGRLAFYQGDLERASEILNRALAIFAQSSPGTMHHIQLLLSLGRSLETRGDLAAARQRYEQALVAAESQPDDSPVVIEALLGFGNLLRLQERWPEAEDHLSRAHSTLRRVAPGGLHEAEALDSLGRLAGDRGNLEAAERRHRAALATRSRLAPGSATEADSLGAVARILVRRGRGDAAIEHYRRALAAVESQLRNLGGTEEIRTRFAQRFAPLYKELFGLLLERGREAEGFEFLERYRGQSFLSMLAEKDLVLTADLPESLASERLRLRHLYEKNRHALEELGPVPGEDPELLRLVAERRALAVERQRIWESVRRIAPRLASRRGPRPARPGEAARSLPKKTALLSFAVDREVGYVQVLRRDQDGDPRLSSAVLAVGADELRARVEAFRLLLRSPSRDSRHLASLTRRGSDLYRLLVAPVAPALAGAEEIVILPDGPLHGLPFAALVAARESPESGRPVFLVERFALRMAASAGELSVPEQRDAPVREAEGVRVAAFGDPWLKPSAVTGPVASLAPNARLTRAAELGPLPFARLEVEMIADLFPRAETRVGREATEGRVKRLAENLEIVHFACHSVIDERFPLDSYLALSPDAPVAQAGDDGLLQAWEIFEEVRLEADLVTLSACDTGLAGEGLVGLTQAFHYAGARSVLASLWRVSDRSSAQLMVRFYRQLKTGLGSSRALRAAQLELLAGLPPLAPQPKPGLGGFFSRFWPASSVPASDESLDTTHPYHWAAFQLYNSSG